MFLLNKAERRTLCECTMRVSDHNRGLPPEVIVGHVEVFQCEQEVVKGLGGDFDQLVVVDDEVLQIDQTCEVSGSECCQAIT